MKTPIVITSIFPPTEAIKAFAHKEDFRLIVIGDKKTPKGWSYKNTEFFSSESQELKEFSLYERLPWNHYCRKLLGYLIAMKRNPACLIDTDDDNIPSSGWSFPETEGVFDTAQGNPGFVNIYRFFSDQNVWPRGLPLNCIKGELERDLETSEERIKVGVWQGLADDDPDVDAIYRLTDDTQVLFKERAPVVLRPGYACPFNSQNTLIVSELFELLYLPCFVTFRFTDILRSFVAQPIMWELGYHLGFTSATVTQVRNPHDYMADFASEVPMYVSGSSVIEMVRAKCTKGASIGENMITAYETLLKHGIVVEEELMSLRLWLSDVSNIRKSHTF
jgi:hypothetical protein